MPGADVGTEFDLPMEPATGQISDLGSLPPRRKVGRCELHAVIANGGMATIHLGRWVGAGGFAKTVAVKALHKQYSRDADFVKMFLDEARVVARIRHPNVMPTIDLVDEQGELFIVMDYVEAVTLAHLLGDLRRIGQTIPVKVVTRIMSGVLHGLHAAHEAKNEQGEHLCLIHRDVTPENILVGTDGYARLIDFGIASAMGRLSATMVGQVKGKLPYLSPEQVLGDPLNRQTDVYSASVSLWRALTGRKLFGGKNIAAITDKILNSEVEPPSAHRKELSSEYDEIVLRGLERDRSKRWSSAEDMAEALEGLGELASHRQTGNWIRGVAAERISRSEAILRAVETAPANGSSDEIALPGVASSRPEETSAPSNLSRPDAFSSAGSGLSVSTADATGQADTPPSTAKRGWSRWRFYAIALAAVVGLAAAAGFGSSLLGGADSAGQWNAEGGGDGMVRVTSPNAPPDEAVDTASAEAASDDPTSSSTSEATDTPAEPDAGTPDQAAEEDAGGTAAAVDAAAGPPVQATVPRWQGQWPPKKPPTGPTLPDDI